MSKLTKKQRDILDAIQSYTAINYYPPSYRELAKIMNLVSPSSVKGYLDILKKKGYVNWEEGQPRTLHIIEKTEKSSAT